MLRPGRMDRRLTLQSKSVTRNGMGQEIVSWANGDTVWAEVIVMKGREDFEAKQKTSVQMTRFVIRYRTDVTEGSNRILYENNWYDINSIAEIGRREGLSIIAERLGLT